MLQPPSSSCSSPEHTIAPPIIDIGMDCSVVQLKRRPKLYIAQSVDYFYPIVDDPYTMGKIGFANVVSDLYAIGVHIIDKISLIVSTCTAFTETEEFKVIPAICAGFRDSARSIGCDIAINNIALNPWCIIGGVATAICSRNEFIIPNNAQPDDVLVLTKPLGVQLATDVRRWMDDSESPQLKRLREANVTDNQLLEAYDSAVKSMTMLNSSAAKLMHKFNANAATDITGFGLIGHAQNLVGYQTLNVSFVVDTLPLLRHVSSFARILESSSQGHGKLLSGRAPETSGGLLICFSKCDAQRFCDALLVDHEQQAWCIGTVHGVTANMNERTVQLASDLHIIET